MMAGGAARPPALAVLLSAWSMSVRRRSEVWERYRRSPYCHFSLLWQGRADQAGDGLLRPDLLPVLPGEGGEGGQIGLGVGEHLGDLGEGVLQGFDDALVLGHDRPPC